MMKKKFTRKQLYESWRTVRQRIEVADPIIPMIFITLVTLFTGFVLLLPFDSFGASKGLLFLSTYGGEVFWSWTLFIIGLILLGHCVRELSIVITFKDWERTLGSFIWQIVSPLWIFIGSSFLIHNPGSIGTVIYVLSGGMAWWIAKQMRHRSWER